MYRRKAILLSHVLKMALLIVLLGIGLVACGSNSTSGSGGSNQTPTSSPQVQNCGKVQTGPNGKIPNTAGSSQAGNCFLQAFQQCHAASLTYMSSGIDTIAIRTFTIKKTDGHCVISEVIQQQIVPRPPKTTATLTCTGVTKGANELRITACGTSGDVVVPIA